MQSTISSRWNMVTINCTPQPAQFPFMVCGHPVSSAYATLHIQHPRTQLALLGLHGHYHIIIPGINISASWSKRLESFENEYATGGFTIIITQGFCRYLFVLRPVARAKDKIINLNMAAWLRALEEATTRSVVALLINHVSWNMPGNNNSPQQVISQPPANRLKSYNSR